MRLIQELAQRDAQVGVIGLDYVGLPLALEGAKVGFRVCGVDNSEEVVRRVKECPPACQDATPEFSVNGYKMPSQEMIDELLASTDCVVLVTNHSAYPHERIAEKAKALIDARNAVGRWNGHIRTGLTSIHEDGRMAETTKNADFPFHRIDGQLLQHGGLGGVES